jgi:hypothetical protein
MPMSLSMRIGESTLKKAKGHAVVSFLLYLKKLNFWELYFN